MEGCDRSFSRLKDGDRPKKKPIVGSEDLQARKDEAGETTSSVMIGFLFDC
ncbi:MAG: hypothetical protein KME54_11805 [Tolypothrix brevis GSE-NOS-MK-07-07A]|nr:hypothetical protein [Tolypothrix brevis GSE-NOS-MK-07-07A]